MCFTLFPPEAINIFSGDSSRTQKATVGKLTHGLQWVGKKKGDMGNMLIFLKDNWGMMLKTKTVKGKPTIKIVGGKVASFIVFNRVKSLYFGVWMVTLVGSVPSEAYLSGSS